LKSCLLVAALCAAAWAQTPAPAHVRLAGRAWDNESYAAAATWAASQAAGLVFAYRGEEDYWLAWMDREITGFFQRQNGRWRQACVAPACAGDADAPGQWTVIATPGGAALLRNGYIRLRMGGPLDVSGRAGAARSAEAPEPAALAVRPLAPAASDDDFQRGAEGLAEWTAVSGGWRTDAVQDAWLRVDGHPPKAARIFGAGSPALLVTGSTSWNHSVTQVALKMEQPGEAGVVFGYRSPQDYGYLLVKTGAKGEARLGGVMAGRDLVLVRCELPAPLGVWLNLRVESALEGVRAFVGHAELPVSGAAYPAPVMGQAGLMASGPGAVFDDFRVSPLSRESAGEPLRRRAVLFQTAFAAEQTAGERKGRILPLVGGTLKTEPGLSAATAREGGDSLLRLSGKGALWFHRPVPGDADLSALLKPGPGATARLIIAATDAGGYELALDKDKVALLRLGKEMSAAPAAGLSWPAEARLWREGRTVRASAGAIALQADDPFPLEGRRLGVAVSGQADLFHLTVANNLASASRFDNVETDWRPGAGQWVEHGGMTCMAWSYWISALADPKALLWNAFVWPEDFTADAWAGEATLGEETRTHQHFPYHSIQFIVAGDGRDPDKGYRFSIAEGPGKDLTRLYRNGIVMAETRAFRVIMGGHCNRPRDFQMTVQRQGAVIALLIDGRPLIEFTDPQPLGPGQIAIGCQGCRADFKDFLATVDKPWISPSLPEAWSLAPSLMENRE